MNKIKKFILWLVFSKAENVYYFEALKLKETKSKVFTAVKKLADEKHNSDGKRYYVLDIGDDSDPFIILNSKEINLLKEKGTIKSNVNFNTIAKVACYYTS
jgi:hypothetical protein